MRGVVILSSLSMFCLLLPMVIEVFSTPYVLVYRNICEVISDPRLFIAESEVRVVEGETATLVCDISELQVSQD